MDDLQYIFSLGFSGSDVVRAVLMSFFIAMIASKKRPIWRLCLWGLVIDQAVWPIAAQATAGAGIHSIYASIGALFTTFLDNVGIYIVRFVGILAMTSLFFAIRSKLARSPASKAGAKPVAA